jgi:tetratricopeptide (TPR) repeat protein
MRFLLAPLLALTLSAAPGDPRSLFEEAAQALSSGDLPAAERGFLEVLSLQPNNIGALGNLGVVYVRMERPADAVRLYQRALALAPADSLLNLNLALAYLKQDGYESAKPHLNRVLAANPDHQQARELLATAQLFTGEVDAAVKELERLKEGGSSGAAYLLAIGYLKQGNSERSRLAINGLFESLSPAQANFLAGRAYYESTLFENALSSLESARRLDPDLPGIDRELGKALVSLRRFEDAIRALDTALSRNPSDAEAQYFLGAALVQEGRLDPGIALLEKAKAARPDFWGTYYYLGKAKFGTGDLVNAITLLKTAARLNPGETTVFYLLSRALHKAGRQEEARKAAQRLAELEATNRQREARVSSDEGAAPSAPVK